MKFSKLFLIALLSTGLLASCGGSEEAAPSEETSIEETSTENNEESTAAEEGISQVTIEATDDMKYNLKTIEVNAGDQVVLTLINKGKMPKEAMGHNWTLLKQGVDLEEYSLAAAKEKDNEFQVSGREGDVIIHTKLLGPGESETITFTAPEVGTYPFVCTFPAHYGMMKGDFIVK
jgi:azurin